MAINLDQLNETQTAAGGTLKVAASHLAVTTAGKGIQVNDGVNAKFGRGAVLVGGTLVVTTTAALTASAIFLQVSTPGGTQGHLSYSITNATSFTVTSTSGTDTSTFNWLILDPS